MNEKTPTLSDEPVDEPTIDEGAEREALQEALKRLDVTYPRLNDALYLLCEKSKSPEAHQLAAKLLELNLHRALKMFQEANTDTNDRATAESLNGILGHFPESVVAHYVLEAHKLKDMMSPEVNKLATKMVQVEAVRNEAFNSAIVAIGPYKFLDDKEKVAEMQARVEEDKKRKEAGEETFRIDKSNYLDAVRTFVKETKDFSLLSQEEIDQQVAEVRAEIERMLERLGE